MTAQLYLITPPVLDPDAFLPLLEAALDAGEVACVQLRLKGVERDEVRSTAEILMPAVQGRDVAFILNDDPELAAELGADGVHIGQDDMDYKTAREIVGAEAIVGVTCHDSRHLAVEAAERGADYVAFGAFYPTATKDAKGHPAPEILTTWSTVTNVPCVAIGGITVENARALVDAGADFIATVSGVWDFADGPAAAVRAFNEIFAERARHMDSNPQT